MTPALLLPVALAALAALVVPLAIHLARRSETRPTDFAALRWLRQKPKPRQRLRFDEWPLLALRLLLLTVLAVLLARPVLFDSADETPWIAVVPGVDLAAARVPTDGRTRVRWLAPGFPAVDAPGPAGPLPVASLLRQLDAELAPGVTLQVLVPAQVQGSDAARIRLSRAVDWRIVPGTMPAVAPPAVAPPALTVRFAPGRDEGVRYLRAAATAWQPPGKAPNFAAAPASEAVPVDARHLVWLAPGALPEPVTRWIERGGIALIAADTIFPARGGVVAEWRDAVGGALVESTALGRGRVLRLTRPLDAAAMPQLLDPDFPARLQGLFARPLPAPSRVAARDYAPLPGGPAPARPARDLAPWLALLVAALFLGERWLATRRSRGVAP